MNIIISLHVARLAKTRQVAQAICRVRRWKFSKWFFVMDRDRIPNDFSATSTSPLVSFNSFCTSSNPSFSSIGSRSAYPKWRIFTRKKFSLMPIPACNGAKAALIPFYSRIPRLSFKGFSAVLANKRDWCFPCRAGRTANTRRSKPSGIMLGWLSYLVHADSIFNAKTGLRTEALALHSTWRNEHNFTALFAVLWLAHIGRHEAIIPRVIENATTGQVAEHLGRQWIGCEIQTDYEPLQKQRTAQRGMCLPEEEVTV